MTTDHMELRDALKPHDGPMIVMVQRLHLEELLAAYDALAHPAAPKGKYSAEFEEAWSEYPKRPGASKAATWKAWQARIKAKVSPEAMVEGARRYAAYCKAQRTEPGFIKQPATFFGPGEHFSADWSVSRQAPAQRPAVRAQQQADATAQAMARINNLPFFDPNTIDMEAP